MRGKQSRYFETAALMDEALLDLVQEKNLELVSVKEICRRAGVSRSTFYLHYETIDDLLVESVEHVTEQFLERFDAEVTPRVFAHISEGALDELFLVTPEFLVPYLEFIRDNQRLMSSMIKNHRSLRLDQSAAGLRRHVLDPILDRFGVPEADRAYLLAFYLNGLVAVVNEWVAHDCADPIDHVAALMERCCRQGQLGQTPKNG